MQAPPKYAGLTPRYPSWLTVQCDSMQMLLFQGLSALLPFTAPPLCAASCSKGWPGPSAAESATVQQSQLPLTGKTHWPTSLALRENTQLYSGTASWKTSVPGGHSLGRLRGKLIKMFATVLESAVKFSCAEIMGPCHSHFPSF